MSIHNKINVAVIGATGYTGLDLVLILSKHPKVKLSFLRNKKYRKKISFFDKRIKKNYQILLQLQVLIGIILI